MNAYIITHILNGEVHSLSWTYDKYDLEQPVTSFTVDKTFTIYCSGKLKLLITNAVVVEHVENYIQETK